MHIFASAAGNVIEQLMEEMKMSDLAAALESEVEDVLNNADLSPSEKRDAIRRVLARYQRLKAWESLLVVYVQARRVPDPSSDILSGLLLGPEFAPFRAMGLGIGFAALALAAWYPPRAGSPSIDLSYQPTVGFGPR